AGTRRADDRVEVRRSNQGSNITQKPVVSIGDRVVKGQVIADGPPSEAGEIALGQNLIVAYMPWEGHNYEDAIIISERLVKSDVRTSINIEEHVVDARDTKLGAEEITRDIPNVSEEILKDLDERGIVSIGAEGTPGDYLVGKVTPKGEAELTPEERLLRAILGETAREVTDTARKLRNGASGELMGAGQFSRDRGAELSRGVAAHVGFQANGHKAPEVQVCVASAVFDGAREGDIMDALRTANSSTADGLHLVNTVGKARLFDGRTGESFDVPVTVGYVYIMKLLHLVEDKIHARSTGPYSMITQQPLGGKAQFGGQRFGEM